MTDFNWDKAMKYTVCPPGPEPRRFTASCPEMVRGLMGSKDLTIVQKAQELIPQSPQTPFIDRVYEVILRDKERRLGK